MRRLVGAVLALVTFLAASADARADEAAQQREWDPSITTGGVGVALGSYSYAALMGAAAYRRKNGDVVSEMFIPVAGPWLALRKEARFDDTSIVSYRLIDYGVNHCHGELPCSLTAVGGFLLFLPEVFVLVVDPLAQATGILMIFVGLGQTRPVQPHEKSAPAKLQWSVKPASVGTGSGVAFTLSNW